MWGGKSCFSPLAFHVPENETRRRREVKQVKKNWIYAVEIISECSVITTLSSVLTPISIIDFERIQASLEVKFFLNDVF